MGLARRRDCQYGHFTDHAPSVNAGRMQSVGTDRDNHPPGLHLTISRQMRLRYPTCIVRGVRLATVCRVCDAGEGANVARDAGATQTRTRWFARSLDERLPAGSIDFNHPNKHRHPENSPRSMRKQASATAATFQETFKDSSKKSTRWCASILLVCAQWTRHARTLRGCARAEAKALPRGVLC